MLADDKESLNLPEKLKKVNCNNIFVLTEAIEKQISEYIELLDVGDLFNNGIPINKDDIKKNTTDIKITKIMSEDINE